MFDARVTVARSSVFAIRDLIRGPAGGNGPALSRRFREHDRDKSSSPAISLRSCHDTAPLRIFNEAIRATATGLILSRYAFNLSCKDTRLGLQRDVELSFLPSAYSSSSSSSPTSSLSPFCRQLSREDRSSALRIQPVLRRFLLSRSNPVLTPTDRAVRAISRNEN